ncbi:hypothetical protein HYFRA_00012119 [Hymenoscyphus fraxineus]|uniref:Fungal N-terminal domain-containing protein n=1 Tax=Hymenoscyphus fraxineus TaxID=746836 RepID=A0A9N9L6H4_9HELO|nr:hypothetical protein HYFRA_00012119 [Hymenoscyphus fraxineus]
MPVGFGFSAGDFIAGIGLIGTIINCLKDASNPSLEYQELIRQLYSLQSALIQVKNIKFDGPQHAEAVALWQAASHCHQAVDEFWTTIQKYQPHLREGGSGSLVKDSWRKVKWATCKKGDLAKFKSNLSAHTAAIQLLLNTLQLGHQSQRDQSLAGKIQDLYFACMQGFSAATTATSEYCTVSLLTLRRLLIVFKRGSEIKEASEYGGRSLSILSLPYQVERQQPVYLIDALGKAAPFHLEFVRSAEALKAVLKINFQKIENCAPMIERGNFAIQDAFTKRDIDLNKEWDVCFLPGQKVEMSMVFTKFFNPEMRGCQCPHCLKDSPGLPNEEAEWFVRSKPTENNL